MGKSVGAGGARGLQCVLGDPQMACSSGIEADGLMERQGANGAHGRGWPLLDLE